MSESPTHLFHVRPSGSTELVIRTEPLAVCRLHVTDSAAGHDMSESVSIDLYADLDGYVQFEATAEGGQEPVTAHLDWNSGTKRSRRSIRFVPDGAAPRRITEDSEELRQGRAIEDVPLSRVEAETLSDNDLRRRGLPPRPDMETAPEQFERWSDDVTSPARRVPPIQIPRRTRTRRCIPQIRSRIPRTLAITAESSPTWSGFVLQADTSTTDHFTRVEGQWGVPAVDTPVSNTTDDVVVWIGIDGWERSDLSQVGTLGTVIDLPFFKISTHQVWTAE